jgi:hypothetical protein
MALLMTWEMSSGGSSFMFFVFSFLFSCSYRTRMNDRFIESQYDRLVFTFFVFVSPAERCSLENFSGSWRVIATDF